MPWVCRAPRGPSCSGRCGWGRVPGVGAGLATAVKLAPLGAASSGPAQSGRPLYRLRAAPPPTRRKTPEWGHRKPPSNIRVEPRRAAQGGASVTALATGHRDDRSAVMQDAPGGRDAPGAGATGARAAGRCGSTENTNPKQRVPQITQDKRTLEEHFQAARSIAASKAGVSSSSKLNYPTRTAVALGAAPVEALYRKRLWHRHQIWQSTARVIPSPVAATNEELPPSGPGVHRRPRPVRGERPLQGL